jgi:hypothetical protein
MNSSTLSPVVCAAWCEAGDGHADDHACYGESWELQLTADPGGDAPDMLEVYKSQAAGGPVLVRLSHNGGYGPALELSDVERLRDELSAILAAPAAVALGAA